LNIRCWQSVRRGLSGARETRKDVNRHLKWAYSEAGNVVARFHKVHPHRHVSQLYRRVRGKKGVSGSGRGGGATLGRGHLLGIEEKRTLPRPSLQVPGGQGVSAADTWAKKARQIDCETPWGNLMPCGRRRDVFHRRGPKPMHT